MFLPREGNILEYSIANSQNQETIKWRGKQFWQIKREETRSHWNNICFYKENGSAKNILVIFTFFFISREASTWDCENSHSFLLNPSQSVPKKICFVCQSQDTNLLICPLKIGRTKNPRKFILFKKNFVHLMTFN